MHRDAVQRHRFIAVNGAVGPDADGGESQQQKDAGEFGPCEGRDEDQSERRVKQDEADVAVALFLTERPLVAARPNEEDVSDDGFGIQIAL